MKTIYLAVLILASSCTNGPAVDMSQVPLPKYDLHVAAQEAEPGSPNEAWDLFCFYAFLQHDDTNAKPWLAKAVALRHPEAQRLVAMNIRNGRDEVGGLLNPSPDTVRTLLEDASRTSSSACNELAEAFESGYFGRADVKKAMSYYLHGAKMGNRLCWEALAKRLSAGVAGSVDIEAAYFWISLETRCVDPRSVGGQETWALREQLAKQLSITQLEAEWAKADKFIEEYDAGRQAIDSLPFLKGAIPEALEKEGRKLADDRERSHRSSHREDTRRK